MYEAITAKVLKKYGITLSDIERVTGYSRSTISQVLAGNYKGSEKTKREIIEAIQKMMEERERKKFVPTAQRLMMGVLEDTYEFRDFAMITGESGIGKTYTIRRFIENHPDTLYLKIRVRMPYGEILKEILRLLGIRKVYGSNDEKLRLIMDALEAKGIRMLIVDEADLLVSKNKEAFQNKLEIFREIWADGEGPAVVLVGLPKLERAVLESVETYVYSRIGHMLRLPDPLPDELEEFLKQHLNDSDPEKVSLAVQLARRGFFRTLKKILLRSQNVGLSSAVAMLSHVA